MRWGNRGFMVDGIVGEYIVYLFLGKREAKRGLLRHFFKIIEINLFT